MAVVVEGDQAAFKKFQSVIFKNLQECLANDLGSRTLHPELDHTGQAGPSQRKDAREIQILCDDDRAIFTCIIKDCVVGVTQVAYESPVGGGDSTRSQKVVPSRRKILVDN